MDANFRKYKGNRDVFIIGTDGMDGTGDITIYEEFEDLNEHLKLTNPISETDIIVLHGIITSAKYIPADIGRYVYIIVQDPEDGGSGCIYETECNGDVDALSMFISDIVTAPSNVPYINLTIDNIFIVYGYGLNLGYSIHEDEIDEEALEECQDTAKLVKEVPINDAGKLPA